MDFHVIYETFCFDARSFSILCFIDVHPNLIYRLSYKAHLFSYIHPGRSVYKGKHYTVYTYKYIWPLFFFFKFSFSPLKIVNYTGLK